MDNTINIDTERIEIDINEETTPKKLREIQMQIDNAIRSFRQKFVVCSCCDEFFDAMDEDSQHTEDGRLCADCHETYTIAYDTEEWGAVGVKYTDTGEWVNPCPSWL